MNVGRASLYGTAAAAVLYVAVSAAVMGLVAHKSLVDNGTPFVAAFETIFNHGAWAGKLVAAVAVVSGLGALNGWTLVTAEVSRAVAKDDLFPRFFAWTDRRDTAWFGVVLAAVLPSLLGLDRRLFGVLVENGRVTLRGRLGRRSQATALLHAVRQVEGVVSARSALEFDIDDYPIAAP